MVVCISFFIESKSKFGIIFIMTKTNSEDFIDRPVVMVGLMGAGKTSVGRALARRLGIPFVDSDKEIEAAAGCSVVDIFSMYGEEEFRRVEQRVIERLLDTPPALKVISTGEGRLSRRRFVKWCWNGRCRFGCVQI